MSHLQLSKLDQFITELRIVLYPNKYITVLIHSIQYENESKTNIKVH